MAVKIEHHRDLAMAQDLLHDFRVDVLREQKRCAAVAEVPSLGVGSRGVGRGRAFPVLRALHTAGGLQLARAIDTRSVRRRICVAERRLCSRLEIAE